MVSVMSLFRRKVKSMQKSGTEHVLSLGSIPCTNDPTTTVLSDVKCLFFPVYHGIPEASFDALFDCNLIMIFAQCQVDAM